MYDKIFKRVEQKYLIKEDDYKKLFALINPYLEKDKYFKSNIHNIYFDTKDNDLIINSIEKPIYKDKLRIRSYGTPKMSDTIFFEIKNKYKGTVGKRRVCMTLEEFYNYLEKGIFDQDNQIMKEIDYFIKYYKLVPKIFIAYDRLSYKAKEDDLRVTFDFNLRSRRNHLNLEYGDKGDNFFSENYIIMEIKTLGSLPLWFTHSLSKLKIYPSSFSKYGNIYKKERISDVYA